VLLLDALATAEVVSTIILVDSLRSDVGLILYGIGSLAVAILGIKQLARRRDAIPGNALVE